MTELYTTDPAPVEVDGVTMTCTQVRLIARDGARVEVQPAGLDRAQQAREVVTRVAAGRPV